MSGIFQALLTFVLLYKYAALFLIALLGAMAFPIPAGSILLAASFFSAEGYLDIRWVFVSTLAGNVIGDTIDYWLVRLYGVRVIKRIRLGRVLESSLFKRIESYVTRYPVVMLFVSRFTAALTPIVNVLAGLTKLPYKIFLTVEIIGVGLDLVLLCTLGFLFGDNWEVVQSLFGLLSVVIGLTVVLFVLVHWKKTHPRKTA
jgi:membrane-associated protein